LGATGVKAARKYVGEIDSKGEMNKLSSIVALLHRDA